MKKILLALTALSFMAASSPTLAAGACRDKSGKFIKCPPKPAKVTKPAKAAKPKVCRDKKGHFIKCK